MEEVQMFLDEAKEQMDKTIKHTGNELVKIRAGKAMPSMLDGITVEYYGVVSPLSQIASITTPDARSLVIKPWERKMVSEIERSIINSDLGLNPSNDGEMIRLNIPPLTEERRKNLVKQVKNEAEQGKVSIRSIRKDTNESLRKLLKEGVSEDDVKRAEDKVQVITDQAIHKIDELTNAKEKEIMTI